ncbi:Sodium Bile acid symporter family protein [Caballeronia choica]|uniref:Sodium Bile acid symporter family protein n=1 Tax=Caballeronia choica TaxID=326476 RepID=A0A158FTX8_9BURK|nr:Sodium Bile acid symporter family protein [Caballeronia choica]
MALPGQIVVQWTYRIDRIPDHVVAVPLGKGASVVTEALMILLKVSIVVLIACVGAGTSPSELTYLWRRPALLLRSLAAMYLLVPLVAFGLVLIMPIERGVKAAMLVLAVSAGAPLLPRRLKKLKSQPYIFSLLITSSLVAIVAVPLWVALLGAYFDVRVDLPVSAVVSDIAKTILLPIMIGMALRLILPAWSERLSDRLIKIAGIVLAASGIILLVVHREHLVGLSWQGVLALVGLMVFALFIGQLLGGPNPSDRTALAIACATRHVGIALIVATEFDGVRTAVLVVAYFVTAFIVSSLYLTWRRR